MVLSKMLVIVMKHALQYVNELQPLLKYLLDNQSNPKKGHIKKSLFLSIQSFYNQASN